MSLDSPTTARSVLCLEQQAQALPDDRVVVGDHDRDGLGSTRSGRLGQVSLAGANDDALVQAEVASRPRRPSRTTVSVPSQRSRTPQSVPRDGCRGEPPGGAKAALRRTPEQAEHPWAERRGVGRAGAVQAERGRLSRMTRFDQPARAPALVDAEDPAEELAGLLSGPGSVPGFAEVSLTVPAVVSTTVPTGTAGRRGQPDERGMAHRAARSAPCR